MGSQESKKKTRGRHPRLLALVSGVVILIVGTVITLCGRSTVSSTSLSQLVGKGDAAGFNVLLVTLDTTRRDRLGCYGYELAQTPTIDSLVNHGIQFGDAVTSVPITLPSHATILTGLYPPNHRVRDNGKYSLADSYVTLPETLKAHGYDTAAFIGCFVLDARFGLDQGFDVYDFEVTPGGYHPKMPDFNERPAGAVTDAAIRWLRQRRDSSKAAPFFAWVHYFDPHLPYTSPLQKTPVFASRPYDAEIAHVDAQLKRLLDELDEHGLRDRTLVVLVADHGEALGEHGEPTHGMLLYESCMRVPLILSCPGLFEEPSHVDNVVVGLADLRPTLEDLLGIAPSAMTDGKSLLATEADPNRAIYIETHGPLHFAGWSPLSGLRTHSNKYILAPRPEYYDLLNDTAESRNLYTANPPGLVTLKRQLAQLTAGWPADGTSGRIVSDDEMRRLTSLGYVHAAGSLLAGPLPDPKDMMPVYSKSRRAEQLYGRGRIEEAAALSREVLEECERCMQAARVLAFSCLKLGRTDEAVELLRESVDRNADAYLIRSLAQVLIIRQEYDDAEDVLKVYESVAPDDGRVPLLRGDCLFRQNRPEEAIAQYEEAIRIDENRVGIVARERIGRVVNAMRGGRKGRKEGVRMIFWAIPGTQYPFVTIRWWSRVPSRSVSARFDDTSVEAVIAGMTAS